ncbi:DNA sulfur modification protein DndD [Halogranum amylolyticum]|uniref:DNA sulfur modification protein DndD n=1 Tax=Halogranum amylolyticum TaxID=660520 RepID=A0A1H8W5L9_9EURY|nr:AAA family ATPase [Halogranum amylolyticum]SEP22946.1 DNA sulfur modification protein DndD [Halogranum amylolyticum]
MKITRITLENFMPFYDKVSMDPFTQAEKPLVLVKGENDTGKTSLHTAIKYCFHGVDNRSKRDSFINRQAATEGDGTSKVEISFVDDDGDVYTIERGVKFKQVDHEDDRAAENFFLRVKDAEGDVIVGDDERRDAYSRFINQFIPENVADFFFFDAEQLEKFEEANDEEVREAIETVLGIKEIENAVSDLKSRGKEYERKYSKIESTVSEVEKLQTELDEVHDKKEQLEGTKGQTGKIEETKAKLETKRVKLQDIRGELETIEAGDDKRDQLDTVSEQLESVKRDLDDKLAERNTLRRRAGPLLGAVCAGCIQQLYAVEGTASEAAVINDILDNREECLCGLKLEENPEHRETLKKRWLELQSTERRKMAELIEQAKDNLNIGHRKELDRYQSLQRDIRQYKQRHEELSEEKATLESELESIERSHLSELKEQEDELVEEIEELESELEQYQKRVGELDSKLEQLRSRIRSQKQVSDEEQRLQKLIELTDRCRAAMEDVRAELVDTRRKTVEKYASETFLELTNRPNYYRGLKITESYELRVLTEESERTIAEQRPSEGQKQIIAYAFIAGLSEYATRNAPVVVDTPIGRLDPTHKNNLLDYYHHFSDQVMILYQPNELEGSDIERIANRTSKHFAIEHRDESQTSSTIVEEQLSIESLVGDD